MHVTSHATPVVINASAPRRSASHSHRRSASYVQPSAYLPHPPTFMPAPLAGAPQYGHSRHPSYPVPPAAYHVPPHHPSPYLQVPVGTGRRRSPSASSTSSEESRGSSMSRSTSSSSSGSSKRVSFNPVVQVREMGVAVAETDPRGKERRLSVGSAGWGRCDPNYEGYVAERERGRVCDERAYWEAKEQARWERRGREGRVMGGVPREGVFGTGYC